MTAPSHQDVDGLMRAAWDGDAAGVADFLDRFGNAHVDAAITPAGTTALVWSAKAGQTATLKLLIERGADVNATDAGITGMMWAARLGHGAAVDMLLAAGADAGILDAQGRTAADWARSDGHADIGEKIDREILLQRQRRLDADARRELEIEKAAQVFQEGMRRNVKVMHLHLRRRGSP